MFVILWTDYLELKNTVHADCAMSAVSNITTYFARSEGLWIQFTSTSSRAVRGAKLTQYSFPHYRPTPVQANCIFFTSHVHSQPFPGVRVVGNSEKSENRKKSGSGLVRLSASHSSLIFFSHSFFALFQASWTHGTGLRNIPPQVKILGKNTLNLLKVYNFVVTLHGRRSPVFTSEKRF